MNNLDDFYYFARVVDSGGFSAASRLLKIPKSRLSRRIAALEERLGVRLINRSSRQISVTEIGMEVYRYCVDLTVAAEAAEAAVEENLAEPRGKVRVSCPTALLNFLVTGMISRYMQKYPQVEIHIDSTNREVDVVREGFDIALRVDFPPIRDSDLTMKTLSQCPQDLVSSPDLLRKFRKEEMHPEDLSSFPSLSTIENSNAYKWNLAGPNDTSVVISHNPRLVTDDMITLRRLALDAGGIVQLPTMVVFKDLEFGSLVPVLKDWKPKSAVVYAVFPSRRGLLPSVRSLLDFMAEEFDELDFGNLYQGYVQRGDEDACILTGYESSDPA